MNLSQPRFRILLPTAAAIVVACTAAAPEDLTATLRALDAAYDRALLGADSVALDSIYRPDFSYLGPGGELRHCRVDGDRHALVPALSL